MTLAGPLDPDAAFAVQAPLAARACAGTHSPTAPTAPFTPRARSAGRRRSAVPAGCMLPASSAVLR